MSHGHQANNQVLLWVLSCHYPLCTCLRDLLIERLMVMLPNTMTRLSDSYLFVPSLSSDTCTDGCDLYCLHEATELSMSWQEDEGPKVTFTPMIVLKLVVSAHNSCPGFCDHRGHLIMIGGICNSAFDSTSRHEQGAGSPWSMAEDSWLVWAGQGPSTPRLRPISGFLAWLFQSGDQELRT